LSNAHGQSTKRAGIGIALIDIDYILKNHDGFKARMEHLLTNAKSKDDLLKSRAQELQKFAEGLKRFKVGSADYRTTEAEITRRKARFDADVALARKEEVANRAKVYYTVYREIQEELKFFSSKTGTRLVMQFSREEADPNDPQSVLNQLRNQVVLHSKSLDITDMILKTLNDRSRTSTASVPPRTRQGVPPRR